MAPGISCQCVSTIRIRLLCPKLCFQLGVVVVDKLRGKKSEPGHSLVDTGNAGDWQNTYATVALMFYEEKAGRGTVNEGLVGNPIFICNGRQVPQHGKKVAIIVVLGLRAVEETCTVSH